MSRRPTRLAALALVTSVLSAPVALATTADAALGQATRTGAASGAEADRSFGPAARRTALAGARADAPALARTLGLSRGERLVARTVERDANGTEHLRYDRTVAGIPVIGGDLVVHRSAGGRLLGTDFATESGLGGVATDAAVSARRATGVALRKSGVSRGAAGGSRLVVWAVNGFPRLAWETTVAGQDADGHPVSRVEYVDANSGDHIAGWSKFHYAQAKGTGKSLYGGKVTVHTTQKGTGKKTKYLLKDGPHGGATTVDAQNSEDENVKGKLFVDKDNVWGNSKTSNRQSAAVDAHYGAAVTWDYFKKNFGRKGIRGNNKGAKSRVHFAKNYDNAFWSDACFCMTYGDGGEAFKPLVSLDVAGHEMVHGITSNTAGLIYFGESGGLNEATSDIFGAMVEFAAKNSKDKGDYYIGEMIAKPAFGQFLRRMDHPSADGHSYECWNYWLGADDVHFTSGPANKFFYMLAEGTGPKTIGGRPHSATACNDDSFGGIGRGPAAKIWYRALTAYMTSTDDYLDARDATIQAARDLNGGANCAAVERAWDAVGVPPYFWSCADGKYDEGANVLTNSSFESGSTGWSTGGTAQITNDPYVGFAHSGSYWANFNGQGSTNTATLSRTMTVPNTDSAILRFALLNYSEDDPAGDYDRLCLTVNGADGGCISNQMRNNTYSPWFLPMGAWKNQTVTVQFTGSEDFIAATQFLIDDVTLTPR